MRLPFFRVVVAGPSMVPALHPGDRLLVRRGGRAAAGDVVVASWPARADLPVVKRVERVLPDGRLWLVGDNPYGSDDSRSLGPLPPERVEGRVVWRYRPLRARS